VLLDLHVTVLFVAYEGKTFAVSVIYFPDFSDTLLLFREMDVAAVEHTVTKQFAVSPLPAVAVISVIPALYAVTLPLFVTEAMAGLLLLHTRFLYTAELLGRTADRVSVFPSLIDADDLFSLNVLRVSVSVPLMPLTEPVILQLFPLRDMLMVVVLKPLGDEGLNVMLPPEKE
jgi:hypothetical protein